MRGDARGCAGMHGNARGNKKCLDLARHSWYYDFAKISGDSRLRLVVPSPKPARFMLRLNPNSCVAFHPKFSLPTLYLLLFCLFRPIA